MNTEEIINRFRGLRVVVVGDIMLDSYINGNVERVSPEAPVPVLKVSEEFQSPGGAANVALNLKALGAKVSLIGITGSDPEGDSLREEIKRSGLSTSGIVRDRSADTTVKTRLIASNQQIVRIDKENVQDISAQVEKSVIQKVESALKSDPGAVIISDYAKGALTNRILSSIIRLTKKKDILTVVDPKGADFTKYSGADVLTPNKAEAQEASGVKIVDQKSLTLAARNIIKQSGSKAVLITRGRDGVSFMKKGGKLGTVKSEAKDVYDVTGAGDTAVSVFTLAYAISKDLSESVKLANSAAGIAVGKLGASQVDAGELEYSLSNSGGPESKIYSRENLAKKLSAHRSNGDKVVFTNGCFDLFHTGHLKLLTEAARLGDALIVAINSDSSVKRLKGKGRPFVNEADRARLLTALDCVTYLTVFSEDTPLELIQKLRPDVLVKGGDYDNKEIVGGEFVRKNGGSVETIPLVDGISTTSLAKRIKKG